MNNNIKNDMLGELLVRQPNPITMAEHSLNAFQLRIIGRILQSLQDEQKNTAHWEFKKTNLGDFLIKFPLKTFLKKDRDKNHNLIKQSLKDITTKGVTIRVKDENCLRGEIYTTFVSSAEYDFKDEFVEIKIDAKMMAQYLSLINGYTLFSVPVIFKLSSATAIRLYQFVARFRDKKKINIYISSLRKWLGLEDKYKEPRMIFHHLLVPAMRELKKNSDVYIDFYEKIKNGRELLGWIFTIHHSKKKNIQESKSLPKVYFKTKRGENCFRILTDYGFSGEQATDIILWCEKNRKIILLGKLITSFANDLNKGKKSGIDDKVAYIAQVLRQNEIKV